MSGNNNYLEIATLLVDLRSLMHKSFPKITREKTSLVNMLIHIYVKEVDRGDITVTSASYSSDLPKTTAMRRLDTLVKAGYLKKYKNCRDGRCKYVNLSKEGCEELELFLKRASQISINAVRRAP